MSTIAENIAGIRAQMAEAAKKAGRDPSEILLCAATKMNGADAVREAIAAGVDCCGENRVQELTQKMAEGAYTGEERFVVLCVIKQRQIAQLKKIIYRIDERSFVIVTSSHEIFGKNFSSIASQD